MIAASFIHPFNRLISVLISLFCSVAQGKATRRRPDPVSFIQHLACHVLHSNASGECIAIMICHISISHLAILWPSLALPPTQPNQSSFLFLSHFTDQEDPSENETPFVPTLTIHNQGNKEKGKEKRYS